MDDEHLVFISYASPDRDRIFEWHDFLKARGVDVWMDKRQLKGGQNWDFEIKRALQKSSIIIVFLSHNSVDRRGYAQREIKIALDQARDSLIDDIYLLPIALDADVMIPDQLKHLQVIRPEDGDVLQAAADAVETQLARLGAEVARIQGEAAVRWSTSAYKESWDGLPGYQINYELLRLQSELYPQVSDITEVIKGWLVGQTLVQREVKFRQNSQLHDFGEEQFFRTDAWEASSAGPKIKGRVLSIPYSIYWYGAGAAHPNSAYMTFVFTLDPVTQVRSLQDVIPLSKRDDAFSLIQGEARAFLLQLKFEEHQLPKDQVELGTETWEDFDNFIFAEDGIEFLFGSYHVGPYFLGPQVALVKYEKIAPLMTRSFRLTLGVDHLRNKSDD